MFKAIWHTLSRIRVAVYLILAALVFVAFGSTFPQRPTKVGTEALAAWDASLRARYGALTDLLDTLGVFRLSRSPILWTALTLLTVSTAACALNRWRAVWRRALRQSVRGSFLGPYAATLHGFSGEAASRVVREGLVRRGFRVREEMDSGTTYLRGERNQFSPLATLVTHLAMLLVAMGATLSGVFAWREELTLVRGEPVEIEHGGELAVQHLGLEIERHPDGSVADYRARLVILRDGQEVARGDLRLNRSLQYGGVAFYLRGYGGTADRREVTLLAVRDPGYLLVVGAGCLLVLGVFVSFNFPHAWVRARVEPDGTLHLSGWAARQAVGFGRDFEVWVADLRGLQGGSY